MDTPASGKRLRREAPVRAPLVIVAAALILGIVAGRYLPLPAGAWLALAAAGVFATAATFIRPHLHLATAAAVAACVFALGAAHARLAWHGAADDDVVTYVGRGRSLTRLRGRIVSSPQIFDPSAGVLFGYRGGPQTAFVLAAGAIRTEGGWRGVEGLTRVVIQQADDRLAAGQRVELLGWLSRPRGASNPGQFDRAADARRRHVLTQFRVEASDGVAIAAGAEMPWYERAMWNVRAGARQHLWDCGGDDAPLLSALVIGERHPALRTLSRTMARAGVAHFLSISGLHLGVFLCFVYLACRVAMLAPRRAAGVVLAVLAAYVLLTEPRDPLLRSAIMAAALCVAVIFGRRASAPNALALAAVVLLAIDPLQLFSAGFQLSFTIVAGILLLHRPVRRALFGRFLRRRGLMVFRDDRRWRRRLYFTAANWLMDAVVVCLVAYLMAAPLVAYHFGIFSPWAPLLSLVLLPLVVAVLVPGYVSLALAWPMPNLSWQFGRLAAWAAGGLAEVVGWIERLPAASLTVREVPAAWALLCYAAVVLIWQRGRLRLGRAWAVVAVAAVAGLTVYTQLPAAPPDGAELNLLAVGDGQCALLRTPDGRTWLIDAGTLTGFDAGESVLRPFLRHQKLPAPEAAFISHANTDHYNAVPALVAGGAPRRVYLNDYFGRGGTDEEPEGPEVGRFLNLLGSSGVSVARLRAGEALRLDDRTTVEVLWPPAGRREDLAASANETSLVLRIRCDGRSVLLTGDIETIAQGALCRSDVRADALVMPHHGGWTHGKGPDGRNAIVEFLEAVAPEVVLVSSSDDPHPPSAVAPERVAFYARLREGYRYYSTARNGWVQLRFGREGLHVHTMR